MCQEDTVDQGNQIVKFRILIPINRINLCQGFAFIFSS